jgi:hypothetical protein
MYISRSCPSFSWFLIYFFASFFKYLALDQAKSTVLIAAAELDKYERSMHSSSAHSKPKRLPDSALTALAVAKVRTIIPIEY